METTGRDQMIFADLELKINSNLGKEILLLKRSPEDFLKTILVIGVMHGDEPSGEYLINRYLQDRNETKNRLLFIPCLNPDGLALGTRGNSNSIDLNRNFPTKNWEKTDKNDNFYGGETPASETETKMLIYAIDRYKPDLIITFHEPYKVVNYDGPAKEIAERFSNITGYPVQQNIGYPTPGSFGTYCGVERNIPTITLELPDNETRDKLWESTKDIFDYITSF